MNIIRSFQGHFAKQFSRKVIQVQPSCSSTYLGKFYSSGGGSDPNEKYIVRSKFPPGKGKILGVAAGSFMFTDVAKWADLPAFECGMTGRKYTHGLIYGMTCGFATGLLGLKLKRGDVVAIAMPNLPEYPVVAFGILMAGLVASPMNPLYTPGEFAKLLKISGSKVVVTIQPFAELMKKIGGGIPIVIVGEAVDGTIKFEDLARTKPNPGLFLKGADVKDDELAILPFSSGTTGPPKGVELTHSNLVTNIEQQFSEYMTKSRPHDASSGEKQTTLAGILPFFHIFGFHIMTNTVKHGSHCITFPMFQPPAFIAALRKHKFKYIHMVTPILAFIVNSPDITKEDLACIDTIMIGAAPVGVNLIEGMMKKAGKEIFFQQGFGMTELSPVSHMISPDIGNSKQGSVGRPVQDTESKIIDITTGEILGPDKDGELCIRGPQIMRGYFKNQMATNEILDNEGWLHTGDIGHQDSDGCLYIVDRIKELIKVKGLQVAPAELEDILRGHPAVLDVAVIAIPNEKTGELPRAYVVKKAEVSEKEIQDFLVGKVSSFKELAGGVEFISEVPKSQAGKILRKDLKADYMSKFGNKK